MPTIDQILNEAYKLTDRLDFLWNFYVAFTAGILGWVFSAKKAWPRAQKVVVTILFTGFAVVSIGALSRTYLALGPTIEALRSVWGTDTEFQRVIADRLSNRLWIPQIVMHILGDCLVLYCIWMQAPKENKS